MKNPTDTYLAVFAPDFIGSGPDVAVYSAPSNNYEKNKALDREKKGFISVSDAARPVLNIIAAAEQRPRIEVEQARARSSFIPLFLFATLVYGIYRFKRRAPMMSNS